MLERVSTSIDYSSIWLGGVRGILLQGHILKSHDSAREAYILGDGAEDIYFSERH